MLSTSMTWSDVILHARLFFIFFTEQPRNPWQMLAESLCSAETQLKITGLTDNQPMLCLCILIHSWCRGQHLQCYYYVQDMLLLVPASFQYQLPGILSLYRAIFMQSYEMWCGCDVRVTVVPLVTCACLALICTLGIMAEWAMIQNFCAKSV